MSSTRAAMWRRPFGMALITWRYLWATLPLHRHEEPGDRSDLPPRSCPTDTPMISR